MKNYSDNDLLKETLGLLSLTESLEAVQIIFNLTRSLTEHQYSEIQYFFNESLFGTNSRIYEKQHKAINDRLYELIEEKDTVLHERGMQLHKEKMRMRR